MFYDRSGARLDGCGWMKGNRHHRAHNFHFSLWQLLHFKSLRSNFMVHILMWYKPAVLLVI